MKIKYCLSPINKLLTFRLHIVIAEKNFKFGLLNFRKSVCG